MSRSLLWASIVALFFATVWLTTTFETGPGPWVLWTVLGLVAVITTFSKR